jgi:hypothetical protein
MRILDSEVKLKENLIFSLHRYRIWWVILLITIVFDYLTTLNFVSKLGAEAEANAVVGWLITSLGLYLGLFIGKILQLISVIIFVCLHQRLGNLFLLITILLNCWAVVNNSIPYY